MSARPNELGDGSSEAFPIIEVADALKAAKASLLHNARRRVTYKFPSGECTCVK